MGRFMRLDIEVTVACKASNGKNMTFISCWCACRSYHYDSGMETYYYMAPKRPALLNIPTLITRCQKISINHVRKGTPAEIIPLCKRFIHILLLFQLFTDYNPICCILYFFVRSHWLLTYKYMHNINNKTYVGIKVVAFNKSKAKL